VQPNAPPLEATVSNPGGGSAGAPSALIGLLRKQGSLKIIAGQRIKNALAANSQLIAIARQHQRAGAISAGHTLASGSTSLASQAARLPNKMPSVRVYTGSDLLTSQENADCQARESQKLGPVIYEINGQPGGQDVVYAPDPSGNTYTITGCGFGDHGDINLLFYNSQNYIIGSSPNFQPQRWLDNAITVTLDPNIAGFPDMPKVQVLIITMPANGKAWSQFGTFYARRQPIPLPSIAASQASLYSQGSPLFLSPVSNYYGLTGTVGVMRQGMPANSLAGQDKFTVQLAPGFAIDSTQTDLLVSDANSNIAIKPATVNGNTITVTYPILSSGAGASANYYSIYGLTIWVTGPAGVNPLAP